MNCEILGTRMRQGNSSSSLSQLLLQNKGSTKYFSVEPLPSLLCNTALMQAQRPGKEKRELEGLDMTVQYFPWKV